MDAVDPALRRFGRFDDEIEVTTPSEEERLQILQVVIACFDLDWLYLASPLWET